MTERKRTILRDAAAIRARVASLAAELDTHYAGAETLVVVAVLDGAFVFAADLVRAMRTPCRVEFVKVSSYREGERRGALRLVTDDVQAVEGEHLLLVDDICDSGSTLRFLVERFASRDVASCRSCVLLRRASSDATADHVGFEVGPGWVVGYGMDLDGRLRDLPQLEILD